MPPEMKVRSTCTAIDLCLVHWIWNSSCTVLRTRISPSLLPQNVLYVIQKWQIGPNHTVEDILNGFHHDKYVRVNKGLQQICVDESSKNCMKMETVPGVCLQNVPDDPQNALPRRMIHGNLIENLTTVTVAGNGKKTLEYGVEHILKELRGIDRVVRHKAKEGRICDVNGATKISFPSLSVSAVLSGSSLPTLNLNSPSLFCMARRSPSSRT
jgi:hypothetical protein